jgi:hypothetical protein
MGSLQVRWNSFLALPELFNGLLKMRDDRKGNENEIR